MAVLTSAQEPTAHVLNDVHGRLNPTAVRQVVAARSVEQVQELVLRARDEGRRISMAGGRHAMGGQQFGAGTLHLDTRGLDRVIAFDGETGRIEAQAGIEWPQLIQAYHAAQHAVVHWGIAQKQTGADRLSLGGAVSANIHGRGLTLRPFVQDIESLTLVDADGALIRCDRTHDSELFALAIGGYGLFGVVVSVELRLTRRRKLQRLVELRTVDDLIETFDRRIADGCLYGDFQFAIDPASNDFLRRGVFCCYQPVDPTRKIPDDQIRLSPAEWSDLLYLAHRRKQQAFERFSEFYLRSSGQLYWSDTLQLSYYLDDYHRQLDLRLADRPCGTEMITELYVPRQHLSRFLDDCRTVLRRTAADLIYGTVRLIERDDESYLPWARDRYACVIFNLHTEHTPKGLRSSEVSFRALIDAALRYGGSFYLTYHRYADRGQVSAAHPRFESFLQMKRKYDPSELFHSDWYGHYRI